MNRFFVAPQDVQDGKAWLTGSDVRHALKVLRLGPGDEVAVLDGCGLSYLGVIVGEIERNGDPAVELDLVRTMPVEGEPPLEVILIQGIPKSDKMDFIVQKAVELGTARIYPVEMQRTVVRLDDRKSTKRCERWRRIAYEAAKQSRRGRIPTVDAVTSLQETLDDVAVGGNAGSLFVVPWEEATVGLKDRLAGVAETPTRVIVAIGPEGGMTRDEIALMESRGALPVSLGPRILRTETAGLVSLTVLMYALGDLGVGTGTEKGEPG